MLRMLGTKLTLFLALLLLLTGCTYNPFHKDNQLTGSAAGTAIGAGAGAGTAALLGASRPVIALAGLGGAGLGYYVTTLRFASGGIMQTGGQVYSVGDYVTIEIPTDKIFDTNSSDFEPDAGPVLYSALAILNRYPNRNIMISGNTSGFGSLKYEHQLSEDRAKQVAGFLWAHGINTFKGQSNQTRKLVYTGYGNYFPIANNLHSNSIRKNSRIQITIYPSKAELKIDKKHKIFNNIGDINEPNVSTQNPQIDFNKIFPGGNLSASQTLTLDETPFKDEQPVPPPQSYNQVSPKQSTPPEGYIPSQRDAKGEAWENYNSAVSTDHTRSGGNVIKHGGSTVFKDER